jgi:hypothetical protein
VSKTFRWLRRGMALALVLAGASLFVSAGATAEESEAVDGAQWRFRVFLDDHEIGYHNFSLTESGGIRHLKSVASFEYKVLFVPLYRYEHENQETWSGDCLQRIESRTDANGKPYEVEGWREDGAFYVDTRSGESRLPGCVMSFAYWNPDFLEQSRLLNSQNGEYLPVEVSEPVPDTVEVHGEARASVRYRLAAGPLKLNLWYSEDKQWLALESEVSGGRTLRYELM